MSNKWLPLDKYKIYKNTDKMKITLSKGLLNFNNFIEDTTLIITNDFLIITDTVDYVDNEVDDILQKSVSWKIRLGLRNFDILRESLKDSFDYCLGVTDVAPAYIECYSKDKKIYSGEFNEGSEDFVKFLELSLKSPILRKKFGLYRFNKYYDKKKTSFGDSLPF